jgi:cation diffusion facilitator CzcD-associated flavoprotein CzcO
MILIVGAGISGLGMAIKLKQAGYNDFAILERESELGGTWRDNSYPGCACDIPSHLYSFSFEQNPEWTRGYPGWEEILAYLKRTAAKYGVDRHIRFEHEVTSMTWDPAACEWETVAEAPGGTTTMRSRYLVVAPGPLSEPVVPNIPGLDSFQGHSFHSARWDHDYDLRGKRVAVVGTGASAIQFVPEIQPLVSQMTVFQRTAPWVMPRMDHQISAIEKWILRRVPGAYRAVRSALFVMHEMRIAGFRHPKIIQQADRIARRHLSRQIKDPELRRKLTPDYVMGCKRILISDNYYPALQKPNVELVTGGVAEVGPDHVTDAEGLQYPVDTIIFGTGFEVTKPPVSERVWDGEGRSLAEHWADGMQAHRGTTIAGFPNLFFMLGPNTGLGHNSMIHIAESQIAYILQAIESADRIGAAALEVTPEAQAHYNRWLAERLEGTVWTSGGCSSWYLDENGKNTTLWPGSATAFRRALRTFDIGAYEIRGRDRDAEPAAV